jgi:hypothetical protein
MDDEDLQLLITLDYPCYAPGPLRGLFYQSVFDLALELKLDRNKIEIIVGIPSRANRIWFTEAN